MLCVVCCVLCARVLSFSVRIARWTAPRRGTRPLSLLPVLRSSDFLFFLLCTTYVLCTAVESLELNPFDRNRFDMIQSALAKVAEQRVAQQTAEPNAPRVNRYAPPVE